MTQEQAREIIRNKPGIGVRREYGITEAELYEIARRGAVSAETQAWADDLRARCPKAFRHG